MPYSVEVTPVNQVSHAVEIDQQADENFVGGWAVFVDAGQIAKDGYRWYIFAMESKYTGSLGAKIRRPIRPGDSHIIVMDVVGGGNLGQKPRDHLDDIRRRHRANLILAFLEPLPRILGLFLLGRKLCAREAPYMRKISDLDATGRAWPRSPN